MTRGPRSRPRRGERRGRQYYKRRRPSRLTCQAPADRPASLNDKDAPRTTGEKELADGKAGIDGVHAAGGVVAPTLWHVGNVRTRNQEWTPPGPYDSPSGLSRPDKAVGAPMTDEEVDDAIRAFAEAAGNAKKLGFDAIELHGAHGYLIDQFFWEGTNLREDAYGAKDLPGRARFAADILKAVRQEVGPDYPVIIRISQWKQQDYEVKLAQDPKALEAWLGALVDAGADILHCSQRRFWEPEFEGSDLNFAGWAKKVTGVPTITVGSVGLSGEFIAGFAGEASQPASLESWASPDRGDFDLVGRPRPAAGPRVGAEDPRRPDRG